MIDIVGKRNWFFIISLCILVPGLISMAVFGFKPGIDFSSGTTMTLHFETDVDQGTLREEFSRLGHDEVTIQRNSDGDYFIRLRELLPEERDSIVAGLEEAMGTDVTVRDLYTMSPLVASEVARNAAIAVGVAAVFMLLYIVFAFRKMPNPFRWGACAVICLVHDALIVMGIFSIMGWVAGIQVDALFITAMLTVVGYSITNTVVVYDRIRENVRRGLSRDFETTVNSSVLETMTRCLNTSLTTVFAALAIFLFGGATIHYFILALLLGVLVGAYDSIFIAGPLLVLFEKGFGKKQEAAARTA